MPKEQLIEEIFEDNFSKAQGSPLYELLIEATLEDYKRNLDAIEKLK